MTVEINRVLPPDRKVPIIEFGKRATEVMRLHRECFPGVRPIRILVFTLSVILVAVFAVVLIMQIRGVR